VEGGGRLTGRAHVAPSLLPVSDGLLQFDACKPIATLFASAPAGVAILPAGGWAGLLGRLPEPAKAGVDKLLSLARPGAPCMLALLQSKWNGRLRGLPAPTLVAAIPLRDGVDAAEQIVQELDEMNVRQGLGLIPRRLEVGGWELIVIDDTRSGFLSRIEPRYRPAFAVAEGWLLFGSNADSLGRLVSRTATAGSAGWLARLAERPSRGVLWVDSRLASPCVLNALALVALGMTTEGPGQVAAGNAIRRAMSVADRAHGLGDLYLWATPGAGGDELLFELDPPR